MSLIGVAILGWFALLAAYRCRLAIRFRAAFSQAEQVVEILPDDWPRVVAIMALRGGDEALQEALERLMTLDYPDYSVRLVLDSENDPVRPFVEQAVLKTGNTCVEILTLPERRETCSGKISGLLYGTEDLPLRCEVVAIFDGDAVLHASCLRELVAPLRSGSVLTTGNRWYAPQANLGGMVRYLWNGLAVTVMNAMNIPWGGCMAMKVDVIQHSELRHKLANAFGEDSAIATFLIEQKERVQFVPKATLVNAEGCTVREFYNFLLRQYLTVRMNNPGWKFVLISNILLGLTAAITNILLLTSIPYRLEIGIGYLLLILALSSEILIGAYLVRKQKARAGISVPQFTPQHWLLFPVAMVILNYINLAATFHSALTKQHLWRGITYEFPGQHRCHISHVAELRKPATATMPPEAISPTHLPG